MSDDILTHEYLKARLHYSLITGEFYWRKVTSNRVKVGSMAGSLTSDGYRRIGINGKPYRAHSLAWFWVTGKWPGNEIDHKNGVKTANQWLNLREATRSQNAINIKMHLDNTSGCKGVV